MAQTEMVSLTMKVNFPGQRKNVSDNHGKIPNNTNRMGRCG